MQRFEPRSIYSRVCSRIDRIIQRLSTRLLFANITLISTFSLPVSHVQLSVSKTCKCIETHERLQLHQERSAQLIARLAMTRIRSPIGTGSEFQQEDVPNALYRDLLKQQHPLSIIDGSDRDRESILRQLPDQVQRRINFYSERGKRDLLRRLDRGEVFIPMIQQKIIDRGLPAELAWIPLLESSYHARANNLGVNVGLWQLAPSFARQFGLQVKSGRDERFDPEKSTDAALDALEYLYSRFGDWTLAMAAYNAGEFCIADAIERSKTRDFWAIAEKQLIPKTTHFFVSSILAIQHILENPSVFGLEPITSKYLPQVPCDEIAGILCEILLL